MKIQGRELAPADLFVVLWRFLALILACALVGFAAGYALALRRTEVTYVASADVFVQAATVDEQVGQSSTEIALGRALATSCRDAVNSGSQALYDRVKGYFAAQEGWTDLSNITNGQLAAMVSASVESNAQIVRLTVTSQNGDLAIQLANAIAHELEDAMIGVIGACHISTNRYAESASSSVQTSKIIPLAGGVAFAFFAYMGALLFYILDPRVRDENELVAICPEGVPLLGTLCGLQEEGGARHDVL